MSDDKRSRVLERHDISGVEVKELGGLEFVHEYGNNGSKPSYQEASGAPVENVSPLGLEVTSLTTVFLNIGQMIGTGPYPRFILLFLLFQTSTNVRLNCRCLLNPYVFLSARDSPLL